MSSPKKKPKPKKKNNNNNKNQAKNVPIMHLYAYNQP